jgi:hypothetical protein
LVIICNLNDMKNSVRPKNLREIVLHIFDNPSDDIITEYDDLESDLTLFDLVNDDTLYCKCCCKQIKISNIYRHCDSDKHNSSKLVFFIKRNAEIRIKMQKQVELFHTALQLNFDKKIKGEITTQEFMENMSIIRKTAQQLTS